MKTNQSREHKVEANNIRVAALCLGMVAAMGGLAYASVPLYQLFCQVTGYAGTTQRVETIAGVNVLDREITVRFDANISTKLDWRFKPVQREITIKLGELAKISYEAENLSDEKITGTATFNVTPQSLGAYFNKTECFCFTETEIAPRGKLDMPVVFFIDPEMDLEKSLKDIQSVTLSYTFFPTNDQSVDQKKLSSVNENIVGDRSKL